MKQEVADQWIAALRSGKYKQNRASLRCDDRFCCLGVLCDLHAIAHPDIAAKQKNPNFYMRQGIFLPVKVQRWAGMRTRDGSSLETAFSRDIVGDVE